MPSRLSRSLGSIYTPPDFAAFLASWAIRAAQDTVLDIGIGEGVFVFAALDRLVALGADSDTAREQIYGAEIHQPSFASFLERSKNMGGLFPNVRHGDFFAGEFPLVDAVIGNPPYVRRAYLENVDVIRQRVLGQGGLQKSVLLSRLTDLYVYFLLHATTRLKPGGRLATIVADPWLNVGYGVALKAYLRDYFTIDSLVTLDRRVFEDAEVKPVLLLATRLSGQSREPVRFFRVRNGLPLVKLAEIMVAPGMSHPDITVQHVATKDLHPERPWTPHFRTPQLQQVLASHPLMTTLGNLAQTRIGLQTLAKEFFVLSGEQAAMAGVESEYLQPLAQSSRGIGRTLEPDHCPTHHLFYCSSSKDELAGTRALEYILQGERATVAVRGKGLTVTGYHRKDRIQRANRTYWYDLRTSLERRGRASILIPRLIYKSYTTVWNEAKFVPGELFVEVLPLPLTTVDVRVYLAVLTSSITELLLRNQAQLYGGGTYNISPGQITRLPFLNLALLNIEDRESLADAYNHYLTSTDGDRSRIDHTMSRVLGLDAYTMEHIHEYLTDLLTATLS